MQLDHDTLIGHVQTAWQAAAIVATVAGEFGPDNERIRLALTAAAQMLERSGNALFDELTAAGP